MNLLADNQLVFVTVLLDGETVVVFSGDLAYDGVVIVTVVAAVVVVVFKV